MKQRANAPRTKRLRIDYLMRFAPIHYAESKGDVEIIFIDESAFNIDNQGRVYGWSKKGIPIIQTVPAKIENTTLCAAISNKGVIGYQIFERGMKGPDFLGFMSKLS